MQRLLRALIFAVFGRGLGKRWNEMQRASSCPSCGSDAMIQQIYESMILWLYESMILWLYEPMILQFYAPMILQLYNSTIQWFYHSTILWFYNSMIPWFYRMPHALPCSQAQQQNSASSGRWSKKWRKIERTVKKKKKSSSKQTKTPPILLPFFFCFAEVCTDCSERNAIESQWNCGGMGKQSLSAVPVVQIASIHTRLRLAGGKGWADLLHWFWGGFQVFWGSWEQQERLLEGYCPCPIPAPTASSRPRAASSDPPCGVMKCSPNIPPEAQVGHREHAILCFSLYLFTLPRLLFYSTKLPWHPKSFLLGKSKKAFLLILFSVTFEYSFTELFLQHCLSVRNKCRSQLHRLHFWVCNSSYVCMHLIFVSNNNN